MTVKITPGRVFEVVDEVRCLRLEFVEGGSLLVTVKVDDVEGVVAIEPREVRQLSTFLG